MRRLGVTRLVRLLLVLAIVSGALVLLIDLTPGDPAYSVLGPDATKDQVALVHRQLHLNEPFYERYGHWLAGLAHLDFGTSYISGQPVVHLIAQALPVTAELVILTICLSLAVSVPLGGYLAYRAGGRLDRFWALMSSVIVSIPSFVIALTLAYAFAIELRAFAPTGWVPLTDSVPGNLSHLVLPVVTLSLPEIATYSRVLRADMISTLQEDYILAARSRGVPTLRILVRHALRPSSFSLLTVAGLSLGRLLGSAVVVEMLFALPGLGQLLANRVMNRDIPTVEGVVMFIAVAYVVINTCLDLVYGYLDPRTSVSARLS